MLDIDLEGVSQLQVRLNSLRRQITDLKPIIEDTVLPMVQREIRRVFRTRGYGTWAPLHPATIAAKGHDRPLIRSRRLFRSLTNEDHADAIVNIDDDSLTVGTDVPYAIYHESENIAPRIPARPIFALIAANDDFVQRIVSRVDSEIQSGLDA